MGRSKRDVFAFLKERIWKKTHRWKEKMLSRARKEVLIKSVLQSIPTYVMFVFLLPTTLCSELTAMVRKFWWCSNGNENGIAWRSWKQLCRSKQVGGLGFRDIELFNLAFLAK